MTIRTLALIAVAGTGCFHPQYDHPTCGPGGACPSGLSCVNDVCVSGGLPGDGGNPGGDGGNPGGDGGSGGCMFATLVDTCQLTFDADLMVTADATYDTDTHVLMIGGTATSVATKTVMIGADPVDVIAAHDVHLATSLTLRATGSHGLAIIANHDFTLEADAQIDVSNGGAGARTACPNGATKGQDNLGGGGGGGGGGFGADGGHGGDGKNGGSQGGSQGQAELSFPTGFHGGCPGADGGTGNAPGGLGGKGGGALYVVAAGHIVFNSTAPLYAGGSGGAGGSGNNGRAGGGGGGSGGLLILEAPHVLGSAATVAANGGAGGEGSDLNGVGANGANASVTTARATGGAGAAANGGDGGDGGSVMVPVGDSVTATAGAGGGGGGGAVGFIRVLSSDAAGLTTSPARS